MNKHILYSFRRCPYAIRARWALREALIQVELREVNLKDKPIDLINKSQNKTVPLLILNNGEIIEESLEIILWAISNSKILDIRKYFPNKFKDEILNIIKENDKEFKIHLDRFKYASRFDAKEKIFHFLKAQKIIQKWNFKLINNTKGNSSWLVGNEETIADWSLWPFLRQFKIACENQKISNYFDEPMIRWFNYFETNKIYKDVMEKYEIWNESSKESYFPLDF